MSDITLKVVGLIQGTTDGNYSLLLEEFEGERRLPILIGSFEAQAIAVSLEKMQPNRPLTHDLFKSTLDETGSKITEVIISEIVGGVFHATVIGKKADGSEFKVDARSSDAIAMAVRFGCPIFTTEEIMDVAGIVLDSPSKAFTNKRGQLSEYSIEELERLLKQVLAKEDYESASKIRDAIAQKNKS